VNYIESFQETKIDLANNSAEYGAVGQVTIISKSGTNALRGSVFDYYATPWFRAREPFAAARQAGVRHEPGWGVGGPVVIPKIYDGRNRTFFYQSFETARGSMISQNMTPTVATAAWREGDFSSLAARLVDPTTGQQFPGNKIPAARLNPVSQKIQEKFFPLPNFGDVTTFRNQNYREQKPRPFDPSTYITARIDHKFSDKDLIFGRYTWSRLYNRPFENGQPNTTLPTIGQRYQQRDNRAATMSWTHTISPSLLNELRWGFGFNNNPINYDSTKSTAQNGLALANELGLEGLAPDLPDINGILRITFSNPTLTGLAQTSWWKKGYRTHTQELQDHLSFYTGKHNFKFGFNILRAGFDDLQAGDGLFGDLTFTNRFTGHPYANFLLGIPTTAKRDFPPMEVNRSRWSYDFFVADDLKLTQKLTLNLGVRYETHLNWTENNDRLAIFDVTSGNIVVPDGALSKVSSIFPKNYVDIVEASSLGLPSRTLIRNDRNNIAPRIGAAYRPWGNNTVFRAGWGVFYNTSPFVYSLEFGKLPFALREPDYTNSATNPQVILPRVYQATGATPSSVDLPAAQNPGFRTPYSMQYNFTVERQQWNTGFRFSYIGTAMRKAAYRYNYNSPVPDTRSFISKPRPFPNYPAVWYVTNGAGHQYNGFTAEVTRQFNNGLYLQSAWTWARDIYDLDYNWDLAENQFTLENPFDRKREVAPSADIPTHRWNTNFIYQLPFGRGRHWAANSSKFVNLLVGGWEISGIWSTQTGRFLTPSWTGDDPVGIFYTNSSTPASVSLRPDILRDPNLPSDQQSVSRWFDTTAFAAPQKGSFGTSGKGVIKGPGINVWHAGFHKDFFITETARLRWEMTAVNFFNHPNWGNPNVNITNTAGVGMITTAGGITSGSTGDRATARAFRMGLRFTF
jgi:hypothetical protein